MSESNSPLKVRQTHQSLKMGCVALALLMVAFSILCSGFVGTVHLFSNPLAFAAATALASCTAVPYFVFLWWLDRNEPEPLFLLLGAFFWGALVSTAISGIFNDLVGSIILDQYGNAQLADQLSASLSAPIIEELTKGFALLILFVVFIREFDNLLDGIIYGGMIGLGFAWFENILYYMKPFMDASGTPVEDIGEMVMLVYVRGIVSAAGGSHVTFTALTGFGFGLLRHKRNALWVYAMPFVGLGGAMLVHFAWNSYAGVIMESFASDGGGMMASIALGLPLATLLIQGPFALFLMGAIWFAWRHEEKILQHHLKGESAQVVSPDELTHLVPVLKRTMSNIKAFGRLGPRLFWREYQIQRHQVELAFAKWHNRADKDVDWPDEQDAIIMGLREKIIALKQ